MLALLLCPPGDTSMVNAWIPILIYILVAIAFGVGTLLVARLVAPHRAGKHPVDLEAMGLDLMSL